MMKSQSREKGFALIATLFMIVVIMALMGAYAVTSNVELATTRLSKEGTSGFYAAEAGLNIRAEEIRQTFVGYNRPEGYSPSTTTPCEGGDNGDEDFACKSYDFGSYNVSTYMLEDPSNPIVTTIPPGELYQGLNAQEYRYTVHSIARGKQDREHALLELRFKVRLVPLFQFVAFYDKDLEILPGPQMTLNGPVHTNGDLYLESGNSAGLTIRGQVSVASDLYRGRKNNGTCTNQPVYVYDPLAARELLPSCPSRTWIDPTTLSSWNGMIQVGVDPLTVPDPDIFDPNDNSIYWEKADLRLVLNLDSSNNVVTTNSVTGVEVRNLDDSLNASATNTLHNTTQCPGGISGRVVGQTNKFYNNREGAIIRMIEVDMRKLFDCLYTTNWLGGGKALDDDTEGGLVFHFTVKGPNSELLPNTYGVRLRNAATLQSTNGLAPLVRGLSVVTDQAAYTIGHYNSTGKIPSAIMADSLNVLSTAWNVANETGSPTNGPGYSSRNATNTTINSAFLAGTDTTGGPGGEGEVGQGGAYNGGLENYPRFHERWTSRTLTYRGSFVSLGQPEHADGVWIYGSPYYEAPNRAWDYDTDFNDAANLPPLTPRFVYLRQELFVRDFERQ